MLFPNILTNPIISKIRIFVTSHFRTLCTACVWCVCVCVRGEGEGEGDGFGRANRLGRIHVVGKLTRILKMPVWYLGDS